MKVEVIKPVGYSVSTTSPKIVSVSQWNKMQAQALEKNDTTVSAEAPPPVRVGDTQKISKESEKPQVVVTQKNV